MQTTVTILGGLEITVEFHVQPADPDVGIMSACAEDWHIVEIAGRALRKKESANWLYKRIEAKKGEEDRIIEACNEAIFTYEQPFDEPFDEPEDY